MQIIKALGVGGVVSDYQGKYFLSDTGLIKAFLNNIRNK